jgi:PAS domain S-box
MFNHLIAAAIQKTSECVILIDIKLTILYVNEGTTDTFQYNSGELVGKSLMMLIPMQFSDIHQVFIRQFLDSENGEFNMGEKLDTYGIRKDGSNFPVLAKITKITEGEKVYLFILIKEIQQVKLGQEKMVKQVRQLDAIRKVDSAITSGYDLDAIFDIVLDEAISQLNVDAACILRYDMEEQKFIFAANKGFQTDALRFTRLNFGEGYAGQAASYHKVISVMDLRKEENGFLRSPFFKLEGFVTFHAIPLVVKEKVMGVLEVFFRKKTDLDAEWLKFLQSLADQTAIALDNAQLFYDLKQANQELVKSYDETIEGWSRALDLRDHETEGHTRRVTEMTLKLAKRMGIPEKELVHIRRGALLHDIGKLGVPDRILLKPDKLTPEETIIMHEHPVYSFEMLYPIAYLRPALDIPYCHHEKWDGSGYPRGLRKEEIPLSARIFACVDVWDALRSNRPYRPAWTRGQVVEHMRSLKGIHFDPDILPVFLDMMEREYPEDGDSTQESSWIGW